MKRLSTIFALAVISLATVPPALAQTDEVKLDAAQPKIVTVSAMRVRRAPQAAAQEITRLGLGTVVQAGARSARQDTIGGKTDYWYRVSLPNGGTGWLFGGLLLDYDSRRRTELLRQIIEARFKAENTSFSDRQEIYNLAASAISDAKDANTRGEFELLKLLALAHWAGSIPDPHDKSPYREWLRAHDAEVIPNEFGGGYDLRTELLWNLEAKYHALPIADRIAWEAAENEQPSDCESDEVCAFFAFGERQIKYLSLHPTGAHAVEAIQSLTEMLTDDVISTANSRSNDKYVVQERADLKRALASLRLALAKTSAPEKAELLRKLERVAR